MATTRIFGLSNLGVSRFGLFQETVLPMRPRVPVVKLGDPHDVAQFSYKAKHPRNMDFTRLRNKLPKTKTNKLWN